MGENKISFFERIKDMLRVDVEPGKDYFEKPEVYEREILSGVKWEVLKYGHIKLDEHCPYKQGQLTTIIGHTNVGKTTLILYLLSKLIHKKKVIIYSAENRISQIARNLIAFSTGENHNYKNSFEWLRSRVMFIRHAKQFNYKDMLEQTAIADDIGFKADIIFIDPYNALKVDNKMNGHNYHYEAIEDMRIYTMTTGKSIFLNCHTVTESQRVKPNQYGEIPPPLMSDVEGGSKFPNKSDDVWVIHRNLYHTDLNERYISSLYVGKVRNTEGGGRPTGFSEPIRFIFKKDWTGFTTADDKINQYYPEKFTEQKQMDIVPF
jgi:energy-coupling factor transporter ATP-binding protein EcfA2